MPTIIIVKGYRFFFFSLDRTEPKHIHVEKDDCVAKFWLEPIGLARNRGFRAHEIGEIRRLVEKGKKLFIRRWNEFFGTKGNT